MNGLANITAKDLKGSKLRCLLLTGMPAKEVARTLTRIADGHATVDHRTDHWMPSGLKNPDEAKIGITDEFLDLAQRHALMNWWLAVRPRANTINPDIVSTCTMDGKTGLLIVEAKAHVGELDPHGKALRGNSNMLNHDKIKAAIQDANLNLNVITPGVGQWNLSRDSCYQLSNRFAWSWKIASLGVPVVLVYLGFRNAAEMAPKKLFASYAAWETCVRSYSTNIVPARCWGSKLNVNGTTLVALIQSLEMDFVP